MSDGMVIACDVVLVGMGVRPNQHLAEVSALELDDWIRTDRTCRAQRSHLCGWRLRFSSME
ncbi:FAD-dependent oxidoreductase [uncultured Roseobacter sp.]|uniref:FAD-dependent oxidoreductase n=1 Tax=uncultured Roseobacter sp. TaxID=114847 RepID=UPI00342C8F83